MRKVFSAHFSIVCNWAGWSKRKQGCNRAKGLNRAGRRNTYKKKQQARSFFLFSPFLSFY